MEDGGKSEKGKGKGEVGKDDKQKNMDRRSRMVMDGGEGGLGASGGIRSRVE